MFIRIFFIMIFCIINTIGGVLPNSKKTPGDVVPGIMLNWVCNHYIDSFPPSQKDIIVAYKNYGVDIKNINYRLDHLVPTSLGGSNDIKNLWPQTIVNFRLKNMVENDLFRCVCNGLMSLKEAQSILMLNWNAWKIDSLK